jgi:hypothetical protein
MRSSRSSLPYVSLTGVPPRAERGCTFSVESEIHSSASSERARSRMNARSLWFTCASTTCVGPCRFAWFCRPWSDAIWLNTALSCTLAKVRVRRVMRRSCSRSSASTLICGAAPSG